MELSIEFDTTHYVILNLANETNSAVGAWKILKQIFHIKQKLVIVMAEIQSCYKALEH